jgi:hypothetical protein
VSETIFFPFMWCPLQVYILHFGQPVTQKLLPIACETHINSTSYILALWDVTLHRCINGFRRFEMTYRFYLQAYSGLCFNIHKSFTTSAKPNTEKNGNPQSHRCANFKTGLEFDCKLERNRGRT